MHRRCPARYFLPYLRSGRSSAARSSFTAVMRPPAMWTEVSTGWETPWTFMCPAYRSSMPSLKWKRPSLPCRLRTAWDSVYIQTGLVQDFTWILEDQEPDGGGWALDTYHFKKPSRPQLADTSSNARRTSASAARFSTVAFAASMIAR